MNEIKISGGFYYTVEDGSVTIMGRTDGGLKLVIPPSIDGLPVCRIGDGAFKEQKITGLSLPSGITHIGIQAFYDHHIRNLVIPDTVKKIKWGAFSHICIDLFQSVTIGANVELDNQAIGEDFVEYYKMCGSKAGTYARKGYWYRTQGCALESAAVWDYYIDDGSAVITGYHGKESDVTIPARIDGLDVGAVRGPGEGRSIFVYVEQEIKTLVISEGIKEIKDSAFKGKYADYKSGISKAVIPSSVTLIGGSAFQFNRLTNVTIPPGVTSIGDWAFHHNHLDSITFPEGITRIGKYAFSFSKIKSIVFPDSVTDIGEHAFYYNPLTDVTIGANVKLGHEALIGEIKNMYEKTGGQAGRYMYINGQWRFTPAPEARPAENADNKASDNEKQKSRKNLLRTIAAAPAAAVITLLGVIAAPFASGFFIVKAFRKASKTRLKSGNVNKPHTPEPPPPKAAGTNHVAVVKDGSVEIFGMSFPLINEGWKKPQYYFGGELRRFHIEPVTIHYMERDIPIGWEMFLYRDGSFHGAAIYNGYQLEHQGIVYPLSAGGGIFFYCSGNLESFTVKEKTETNFIVDGKKLALYQYDTLYLYETSGRPKTKIRGHGGHENWIEIDEDGNVTDSFNEKRGQDYD